MGWFICNNVWFLILSWGFPAGLVSFLCVSYVSCVCCVANFTDKQKYKCFGCQDGYMAEYLAGPAGWAVTQMPVDGLRSVMFHGPSPTLCIAAGNVWYDYPAVNKVGCFTRAMVHQLRLADKANGGSNKALHLYDWKQFDETFSVCLRPSEAAFDRIPQVELYSRDPPKDPKGWLW
jgi:hypothetical protein